MFEIDVLVCPCLDGKRARIASLTDGFVVRKILDHLGLDSDHPIPAPARALEESVFAWVAGDGDVRGAGLDRCALRSGAGVRVCAGVR